MPELLLELFSEEIPARMQVRAADELERAVKKALDDAGFAPEGVKSFATPRRLALVATGLPSHQPDRREEKKGPRIGAPEKAIQGFLKSAGLSSLEQCQKREDKKGEYYVAVIDQAGRATADIISNSIPEIVREFTWPKSMRWADGDMRWVRPLHRILCTFDSEIVEFEIGGIAAGDKSEGHRFMAPAEIQTRSFDDYISKLNAAKVILDSEERKEIILRDAKTLCDAQELTLVDDPALLSEVAGLAEWPVAMMGYFDKEFLELPDEVLTASMRGHQKYFSVRDPKAGRLANKFVCVANIESPDGGAAMRAGYERVLAARLADAWFLYLQDLKKPLGARVQDLDKVTFFENLGSIGDKARRISLLAKEIAAAVGASPDTSAHAAMLAKADLVSGMVYEFPELQGVMGRYYAIEEGESPEIADAIRDHYKPAGQDDDVPTEPVSIAVALADKIDTLAAFYAIDLKPTGSKDPFALRRAALGVITIILENNARLDLTSVFESALANLSEIVPEERTSNQISNELLVFVRDRLKVYLRTKGHRHDFIDAIQENSNGELQGDLKMIVAMLSALEAFLKSDDGANLVSAYKRAANILKAEQKKDGEKALDGSVDETHLTEKAEQALFVALTEAEKAAAKGIAIEDFEAAMTALSRLRAPIDDFFETVTVNAENETLRANRLSLLARFVAATASVADFSKLEG